MTNDKKRLSKRFLFLFFKKEQSRILRSSTALFIYYVFFLVFPSLLDYGVYLS